VGPELCMPLDMTARSEAEQRAMEADRWATWHTVRLSTDECATSGSDTATLTHGPGARWWGGGLTDGPSPEVEIRI
jgi:hypothetical protein